MTPDFEDARGTITDLLGHADGITEIFTRKGAVRGNHLHQRTAQWAYVCSGRMLFVSGTDESRQERECGPGEMVVEAPGVPHAWRALEDTVVLVFTRGPRSGDGYESDTDRLAVPLLA